MTMLDGDGTVESPFLIRTVEDLESVRYNLTSSFELANDIDLGGQKFMPLGVGLGQEIRFDPSTIEGPVQIITKWGTHKSIDFNVEIRVPLGSTFMFVYYNGVTHSTRINRNSSEEFIRTQLQELPLPPNVVITKDGTTRILIGSPVGGLYAKDFSLTNTAGDPLSWAIGGRILPFGTGIYDREAVSSDLYGLSESLTGEVSGNGVILLGTMGINDVVVVLMNSPDLSEDGYFREINNATPLYALSSMEPLLSKEFDFSDTVSAYRTVRSGFRGNFDGKGHKIFNGILTTDVADFQVDYKRDDFSRFGSLFGHIGTEEISGEPNPDIEVGVNIRNIIFDNIRVEGTVLLGFIAGRLSRGLANINIENCHFRNSEIVSSHGTVGGIVGESSQGPGRKRAYRCSNESDIRVETESTSSQGYVGGLFGRADGILIEECFNKGDLTGSRSYVGGLVGLLTGNATHDGRILNCYNRGNLLDLVGNSYMGGLVGAGWSFYLENVYNSGILEAPPNMEMGGLVGGDWGIFDVISSYSIVQPEERAMIPPGEYKTLEELKIVPNFIGWDFEEIWDIDK